jgi:hypothetical protein
VTANVQPHLHPPSDLLHYCAQLLPLDPQRPVSAASLGFWGDFGLAQAHCVSHAREPLHWCQLHAGMWEASSSRCRYQLVLFLGALH